MKGLPKNWYIPITTRNQLVVSKWFGRELDTDQIAGMVEWKYGKVEKGCNPKTIIFNDNGYDFGTEISFETFERLVLGINKQTNIEIW